MTMKAINAIGRFKGFGLIALDQCISDKEDTQRHFLYRVVEHTKMGQTIVTEMKLHAFRAKVGRHGKDKTVGRDGDCFFLFRGGEYLVITKDEYESYLEDWLKA